MNMYLNFVRRRTLHFHLFIVLDNIMVHSDKIFQIKKCICIRKALLSLMC